MIKLDINKTNIKVYVSDLNTIEGNAVTQLQNVSGYKGMCETVALPDIHLGKGGPIGVAFLTKKYFYPYLIGNDVGCGMSLWMTNLKKMKAKRDKWIKKIDNLDEPLEPEILNEFESINFKPESSELAFGTLGGGNHFVELSMVESIEDEASFAKLQLDNKKVYLLVHSGSRNKGENLLMKHITRFKDGALIENSDEALQYLKEHDYAAKWAEANRDILSLRVLKSIGAKGMKILSSCHNSISKKTINNQAYWLHRKGAASSEHQAIVIAGTRGSFSYIVKPTGNQKINLWSLAHGAGRKWKRGECKSRLQKRFSVKDLTHTKLGSRIICDDKELLYQEASQAYKNIENIIQELLNHNLISVVATLKPLITYKKRKYS